MYVLSWRNDLNRYASRLPKLMRRKRERLKVRRNREMLMIRRESKI